MFLSVYFFPPTFLAKGTWGRFSALDKLFFHSCDLHVLPVVPTSRHPTPHTRQLTRHHTAGVGVGAGVLPNT